MLTKLPAEYITYVSFLSYFFMWVKIWAHNVVWWALSYTRSNAVWQAVWTFIYFQDKNCWYQICNCIV